MRTLARSDETIDQPLLWEPSLAFLKYGIAFILAGSTAYLIALLVWAPDQTLRALAILMLTLTAGAARILLAHGRRRAVVWTLTVGTWTQIAVTSFFLGGLGSTSIVILPLIVMLIGWLIGARAAIAMAVLTAAMTLALTLFQLFEVMPAPLPTHLLMRWFVQCGVLAFSTILIVYVVRSFRGRLEEVRRLGGDLAARSADIVRQEAEILAARNQLAATLDAIPDLLFEMGLEGRYYDCHTPRTDLLAAPAEDLIGSTVSDKLPPVAAEVCLSALREAHETGRSHGRQFQLPLPQGVFWFELSVSRKPAVPREEPRFIVLSRDITKRKQAEELLYRSQFQLECILGTTADGILAVDREGKVLQTNRRFAELWRIPQALLHGKDDQALLNFVLSQLTDPQAFLAKVQEFYQSDAEATDSVNFKDGRVFERFTAPLILDGKNIGRVWSFRDITERKLIEQRLKMAMEVTQVVFWELDLANDRMKMDPSTLPILGLEPKDVPDSLRSWLERVHPDERAPFTEGVKLALQPGGPVFDFQYRISGNSRDYQWIQTRGQVVQRGPQGQPLLAVGTTMNVSARKRTEDAMRMSEARYRDLASMLRRMCDNVTDMIWAKDLDSRYVFANKVMCEQLLNATDTREPLGRNDMFFAQRERASHPENPQWHTFGELCQDSDAITLARGAPSEFAEFGNVKGRLVFLDVHKAPFHDENGKVIGTVGSARDITEHKRIEEVNLQTKKLESLATLAGGIAHDFNNILAAILGNANLVAEEVGPNHVAAESLAEIKKSTARAGELVRRIQAFGRPGKAQQEVVDLGLVVAEVVRLVRPTLPARISTSTAFDRDAPRVLADVEQIREVIVSLTANAVHATGARAGSIEYRLEPVLVGEKLAGGIPGLKPGSYARLTVTDNGCGMDAAMLDRIFDAFYTTKPVGEGAGLGLSMVHGTMKSHDGVVRVESVPGRGSSFALYFPAAGQDAVKETREVRGAPAQSLPGVGRRVLFVDDEEALVFLAKRVLSRMGHDISGYTDPQEALAAFRAHPEDYDAVVTDLSMPHMSGFDLARAILALRPEIPVLMATGYVRTEDEHLVREIGIRELILKPATIDELGQVLDRWFRASELNARPSA